MTLKDMMLGSAIAALVAGGAMAQTATSTESEADHSAKTPLVETENSSESNATLNSDTENSETADIEAETETDSNMASDSTTSPDAGSTLAPESGMTAQGDSTLTPDTGMGADTDMAEVPSSINEMTVDQILGKNVVGIDDEDVGEVDYVIEQTDGLAFVVGVGGFLGLGEYTVAIPADQFSLNADGDLALSSMTKEELETMPEFNEEGVEGLEGDQRIGDLSAS